MINRLFPSVLVILNIYMTMFSNKYILLKHINILKYIFEVLKKNIQNAQFYKWSWNNKKNKLSFNSFARKVKQLSTKIFCRASLKILRCTKVTTEKE